MKKGYLLNILISLFFAIVVFVLIGPTIASALENNSGTNITYETEIRVDEDNFSQVITRDSNGKVEFITDEPLTHANPDISGMNLVWMTQIGSKWQIFLHQIQTGKTTQLTNKGNNVNPRISGATVVWEGFNKGAWQIYMFDGIKITQITTGKEPKQDVEINGNLVTYSQKSDSGWEIHLYDIADGSDQLISGDATGRSPKIENEVISWTSFDEQGEVLYEFDKNSKKVKKIDKKVVTTQDENSSTNPEPVINDKSEQEETTETQLEPVTSEDIIKEINQEVPESTYSSEETPLPTQESDVPENIEDVEESTSSAQ